MRGSTMYPSNPTRPRHGRSHGSRKKSALITRAVLQNGSQYALVIQGTHGTPDMLEDFACEFWLGFQPVTGANVAIGAQAALFDVLMQTSSSKSNTKGADLGSYLQSISGFWSATNPLLITGHSLGGTLTALAACWIGFQILEQRSGNRFLSLPASIQAASFAPFAAGNQALANCLNNSANYTPCLNQNDAIPHVWATDTSLNPVFNVDSLYTLFPSPGPNPMPSNSFKAAIQNEVALMQKNGVSYVQTTGDYSYQFAYPCRKDTLGILRLSISTTTLTPTPGDELVLWTRRNPREHWNKLSVARVSVRNSP